MTGTMQDRLIHIVVFTTAVVLSIALIYPYYWMFISSFRTAESILTAPLRLLPETFNFAAYGEILQLGGTSLLRMTINSFWITLASTAIAVVVSALGAYALTRRPKLLGFQLIRYGFLLTIMYPFMLLVIPVFIVMFHLGLLGSYTGIILFLSLGPVQFFLFEQFFRSFPRDLIEAGLIDGATELGVLFRVVLPVARPIVGTVTLVTFLLNWSQWFPVLIISRTPNTYTLPAGLVSMNSELGTNFQGIMALATLATLPVVVVFLLTQRRVMEGMAAGAVKG